MKTSKWIQAVAFVIGGVLCLAMMAPRPAACDVFVAFQDPSFNVAPGDTFTAYIVIQQAGSEFNAFDASLRFDPAMLSFEAITPVADQRGPLMLAACANTFHRFTPAPDSLKITLSLLCSATYVTGPGTIYRVRFRASLTEGVTTITLGPFTEFYRAGLFVRPLHKGDMVVTVGSPVGVDPVRESSPRLELAPLAPNPRRGTGPVTLDFTLPAADLVGFDVVDIQGRVVAKRAPDRYGAGRHRLSWTPRALPAGVYMIRLTAASTGMARQRWSVLP